MTWRFPWTQRTNENRLFIIFAVRWMLAGVRKMPFNLIIVLTRHPIFFRVSLLLPDKFNQTTFLFSNNKSGSEKCVFLAWHGMTFSFVVYEWSSWFSLESLYKPSFFAHAGGVRAHTRLHNYLCWGILWMWRFPLRADSSRWESMRWSFQGYQPPKMQEQESQWICGCWAVEDSWCRFLKNLQFNKTQLTPSLFL